MKFLLIAFAATGCATAAQNEWDNYRSAIVKADADRQECIAAEGETKFLQCEDDYVTNIGNVDQRLGDAASTRRLIYGTYIRV